MLTKIRLELARDQDHPEAGPRFPNDPEHAETA